VVESFDSMSLQIWFLTCWKQRFRKNVIRIKVAIFPGERNITSLEVVPSSFLDELNRGADRKELELRGEHAYTICLETHKHLKYSGVVIAYPNHKRVSAN
jgi:hypothetical protein